MEWVVLLVTQCGHIPRELVYSSLNVLEVLQIMQINSEHLQVLQDGQQVTDVLWAAICTDFPF